MQSNMLAKRVLTFMLVALACAAMVSCSSITKHTSQLEPGMTEQQVIEVMGDPANKSFNGSKTALQYQGVVGFGQCQYTTVWLLKNKVVGVSSHRGASIAGCGLGSDSVDWSRFPPRARDAHGY